MTSSIAKAFVDARRSGVALTDYPGAAPSTLADAYAVQDEAIRLWGAPVAGWKLGRILPPLDAEYGAGRLAGPIFAGNVWTAEDGGIVDFPVIPGGFAAVEAEYLLLLGETVPDDRLWTAESVADLIGGAFVAVEIAGSPFSGINDHGPAVTASDFGNNAGVIVGARIEDWRARLLDLTATVSIDGQEVGRGGAASIPGGPLESVAFLLNLLASRGRRLEKGQMVSTGAATGVHRIAAGQQAVADFGPDGLIRCRAPEAGA